MGYFGHAYAAATYLVDDPALGWLSYGGVLERRGTVLRVVPRDGARTRLFVAPAGLWLTLEAGRIAAADYDRRTGRVTLTLDPAEPHTRTARLVVEQTAGAPRGYAPDADRLERGAYSIALAPTPSVVGLAPGG